MRKLITILAATSALVAASQAHAAVISGLVNTGVASSGGVDSNWKLNGGNAYSTSNAQGYPLNGTWLANNATSGWITPDRDQGESLDPFRNGNYAYSLAFTIGSAFNPATASFAGRFLVDNYVSSITLNGTTIFSGPDGGFATAADWTSFGANAGFVSGVNTLVVNTVNIAQRFNNPAGLRVEFTQSNVAPVPEPATWALMLVGFAMVGGALRRRRSNETVSVRFA